MQVEYVVYKSKGANVVPYAAFDSGDAANAFALALQEQGEQVWMNIRRPA